MHKTTIADKFNLLCFLLKEMSERFNLEYDPEYPDYFISQTLTKHLKDIEADKGLIQR